MTATKTRLGDLPRTDVVGGAAAGDPGGARDSGSEALTLRRTDGSKALSAGATTARCDETRLVPCTAGRPRTSAEAGGCSFQDVGRRKVAAPRDTTQRRRRRALSEGHQAACRQPARRQAERCQPGSPVPPRAQPEIRRSPGRLASFASGTEGHLAYGARVTPQPVSSCKSTRLLHPPGATLAGDAVTPRP